jgi:hypothetical protein
MKEKLKNQILLGCLLIVVFILGCVTNSVVSKGGKSFEQVEETERIISDYSSLRSAVDSVEQLSLAYNDTANIEALHYVIKYKDENTDSLPDYYVSNFGDTIMYNKENFYKYVALCLMAENVIEARKHIINGLLLNSMYIEQDELED